MGTKLQPGEFDCYANALPEEPMFILLARDPDFYRLVSGQAWRKENNGKWRAAALPDSVDPAGVLSEDGT